MAIHHALQNFEGYGGRAKRLFIGVEERNPGNDAANLMSRQSFTTRMDLRAACDAVLGAGWWGSSAQTQQPVWRTASKIIAALDGSGAWTNVRDTVLGREGSNTLLTELLPVPLDESGTWPQGYRAQFGFDDYSKYVASMIRSRMYHIHVAADPTDISRP
jgi:hypothetical protein